MSEKGFDKKTTEKDEEEILYSTNKIVCFACGGQVEKETKVCPYCKIAIS